MSGDKQQHINELRELRDELYNGSWSAMMEDLKRRYAARPYIPKLHARIAEDIVIISELEQTLKSA